MKLKMLATAVLLVFLLVGCSFPIDTYMPAVADPVSRLSVTNEEMLTPDDARQIALDHAKVKEADAFNLIVRLDFDDGIAEYDVEFYTQYYEYDYEIHAASGRILSYERDK